MYVCEPHSKIWTWLSAFNQIIIIILDVAGQKHSLAIKQFTYPMEKIPYCKTAPQFLIIFPISFSKYILVSFLSLRFALLFNSID